MNLRGKLSTVFSLNALIWLAMFIALAALLSLAAAAWLALAPLVGLALAALFTGLGLLAVAGGLAVWLGLANRGRANKPQPEPHTSAPGRSERTIEENLRPLIGDQALNWAKQNSGLVMVGAFAAGLVIAASPGARRALTRTAGPLVTRKAVNAWRSFNDEH